MWNDKQLLKKNQKKTKTKSENPNKERRPPTGTRECQGDSSLGEMGYVRGEVAQRGEVGAVAWLGCHQ